jgi:hypothetical protein
MHLPGINFLVRAIFNFFKIEMFLRKIKKVRGVFGSLSFQATASEHNCALQSVPCTFYAMQVIVVFFIFCTIATAIARLQSAKVSFTTSCEYRKIAIERVLQ